MEWYGYFVEHRYHAWLPRLLKARADEYCKLRDMHRRELQPTKNPTLWVLFANRVTDNNPANTTTASVARSLRAFRSTIVVFIC
jgi:hypothetical protein